MSGSNGVPRAWSRRSVLLAGGLGGLSVLTGCGVRLEEDAPRIPLIPTHERTPVADEDALLDALRRARTLERAARAAGGPATGLPATLADLHAEQVTSLARLLDGLGVPLPTPTATPTATATATPTHPPTGAKAHGKKVTAKARAALAAAEGQDVTTSSLGALASLGPTNIALLASLAAQHDVATRLLRSGLHRPGPTGPVRDLAARLLRSTRAAVYGFEVVTAQTPVKARDRASATLESLRTLSASVERLAGASAPPPPLGYRLPFQVHDAASRTKLARHVFTGLSTSTAALFRAATGDADAVSGLVRILADSVVLGHSWGVPLRPFPGLEQP